MPDSERFLSVARIARPQGRRGEVAAELLTDFPRRFDGLRRVFLEGPGGAEAFELQNAWPHKGRIILKFSGVETISDAERLRGRTVLVPREERVELPRGSYYLWELEGCRVVRTREGKEETVGTVRGVERTGGVDLLKVEREAGREVLIPLAETICTRIDTGARIIEVDPPEDLLELNA